MSTPTAGVRLMLEGRERTLRFTNEAIVKLEDDANLTIPELGEKLKKGSLRAISLALWASLQHEANPPTQAEALGLVELSRLKDIGAAIGAAINQAFGSVVEEAAETQGPLGGEGPEGKS